MYMHMYIYMYMYLYLVHVHLLGGPAISFKHMSAGFANSYKILLWY